MNHPARDALQCWCTTTSRSWPEVANIWSGIEARIRAGQVVTEEQCELTLVSLMSRHTAMRRMIRKCAKDSERLSGAVGKHELFVTISFDPASFDPQCAVQAIKKVIQQDFVVSAVCVFEYHSKEGGHPHVHMFIDSTVSKSVLIQRFYKPVYMRKLVKGVNFIDVKVGRGHHQDYLEGNKRPEKQEYVAMDIEWRRENNIDSVIVWPDDV